MKRLLLSIALIVSVSVKANVIGEVNTEFKLIGPSHKLIVEVFDDPTVDGVACYLSRPQKGGIRGVLGIAEETSDASVACRQVTTISFKNAIPLQEEIFNTRTSALFKTLRVVRMVDKVRNTLVYLVYSDKILDGSPKNSVTAVPVQSTTLIPTR